MCAVRADYSGMWDSVDSAISSRDTVSTPNIVLSSSPFTGRAHSGGMAAPPITMPSTEPAVAPLQSVSNPLCTARHTVLPKLPPPYKRAAVTMMAFEIVWH